MSVTKKDQIVDITDDVVTSGDGLYVDSTREERYVYKGTNPNNYIQFNNELWRIVAKEVDGTYKIVKDEPLPFRKFDPMGYRDNGEGASYCEYGAGNGGCNAWAATNHLIGNPKEFTNTTFSGTVLLDSSLNQYLNGEYLSSITSLEYVFDTSEATREFKVYVKVPSGLKETVNAKVYLEAVQA